MVDAPQAIVKVVRNGGTRTPSQIKAQWDYISKDNTVELKHPDNALGATLRPQDWSQTSRAWALATGRYTNGQPNESNIDLTTHIVVSFPPGTDHRAAEGAARDWAEVLFRPLDHNLDEDGSDTDDLLLDRSFRPQNYDYVSAFHTDREHPHLHVVVNRRGSEGGWLKISRRHPVLNYTNLRDVLVDAAANHGIELEASTREERGITDPAPTDAELRRRARVPIPIVPRDQTDRSVNSESDGNLSYASDSDANFDDFSDDSLSTSSSSSSSSSSSDGSDGEGGDQPVGLLQHLRNLRDQREAQAYGRTGNSNGDGPLPTEIAVRKRTRDDDAVAANNDYDSDDGGGKQPALTAAELQAQRAAKATQAGSDSDSDSDDSVRAAQPNIPQDLGDIGDQQAILAQIQARNNASSIAPVNVGNNAGSVELDAARAARAEAHEDIEARFFANYQEDSAQDDSAHDDDADISLADAAAAQYEAQKAKDSGTDVLPDYESDDEDEDISVADAAAAQYEAQKAKDSGTDALPDYESDDEDEDISWPEQHIDSLIDTISHTELEAIRHADELKSELDAAWEEFNALTNNEGRAQEPDAYNQEDDASVESNAEDSDADFVDARIRDVTAAHQAAAAEFAGLQRKDSDSDAPRESDSDDGGGKPRALTDAELTAQRAAKAKQAGTEAPSEDHYHDDASVESNDAFSDDDDEFSLLSQDEEDEDDEISLLSQDDELSVLSQDDERSDGDRGERFISELVEELRTAKRPRRSSVYQPTPPARAQESAQNRPDSVKRKASDANADGAIGSDEGADQGAPRKRGRAAKWDNLPERHIQLRSDTARAQAQAGAENGAGADEVAFTLGAESAPTGRRGNRSAPRSAAQVAQARRVAAAEAQALANAAAQSPTATQVATPAAARADAAPVDAANPTRKRGRAAKWDNLPERHIELRSDTARAQAQAQAENRAGAPAGTDVVGFSLGAESPPTGGRGNRAAARRAAQAAALAQNPPAAAAQNPPAATEPNAAGRGANLPARHITLRSDTERARAEAEEAAILLRSGTRVGIPKPESERGDRSKDRNGPKSPR